MYLYLRDRTDILGGGEPVKILHVGAELCLERLLAAMPKAMYVSTDLMVSFVDFLEVPPNVCMSITKACFCSDAFDVVICSHVLEHVREDRQAIVELFRMIRPGGFALVPVPVAWDQEMTDERADLTPFERAQRYGEADHLRRYGRDYLDRLREAGFSTELFRLKDPLLAQRYRIDPGDPLVVARKA